MNTAEMAAWIGAPTSTRDIRMHPSGIRQAHVSPSGIVWYIDQPEDSASHLIFALSKADVPEHPANEFSGSIFFGGIALTPHLTETDFLRDHGAEVRGHRQQWFLHAGSHSIGFGFERAPDSLGKRSRTLGLARVEIDFIQRG
jgi:hypothetical protein